MISIKNLVKHYGDLKAVADVSFDVKRGEIVGLLGHNGAGKTTVMKIMTGFLEPTSGSISVGGIDVLDDRIGVQRQIGYMPESAPLYREMLVQEYLLMMAQFRGLDTAIQVSAVAEAVKATGLQERLLQPIGTLSKGYRQRVGLAQAILHKPDVLVLDEPTNGLDPVQILEIRSLIRRLAETTTVILSTHILSEIEAVCNRVVILIDGHLAADSSLESLLTNSVVTLGLADDVDPRSALESVDGVSGIHNAQRRSDGSFWRIECDDPKHAIPGIAQAINQAGWPLLELRSETPSLEQVFRDLMFQHAQEKSSGEDAQ
ncbi:MAG: ATP-binding cassette domain-containing protein [Myxococcota bacterium]|nr:ATP-binding cassette domain-containing protein [Myxococcota bacterium]